jgi:hypothetical protein
VNPGSVSLSLKLWQESKDPGLAGVALRAYEELPRPGEMPGGGVGGSRGVSEVL